MNSFQADTHVFIVRIWYERREIAGAKPEWRGVIEHVSSGERRYMKDLEAISAFIAPYLNQTGVALTIGERLKRWLSSRPSE